MWSGRDGGPEGDRLQRKMTVGSNKSAFGVQCDNNPKIPQSEGRVPSPGFVKQVRFCPRALKISTVQHIKGKC